MFDKALQNRSLPKDQWPKQIMGTNISVKLMNTVEDFYDLEETCEDDNKTMITTVITQR